MNKPELSFLIPGFSKCGTTSLCSLLNRHPDIHIPPDKEPLFFIRQNYEQEWKDYRGFFGSYGPQQKLGEGSTFYSATDHEREARIRILKHYPEVRLIFIARDPIDRIESSFREFHHSGARFELNAPFQLEDALATLPALIEDTKYWSRLNNYLQFMPPENIHIIFLEDLKKQPQYELAKCLKFLGVDATIELEEYDDKLNAGNTKLYDSHALRWLRARGWIQKPETEQQFLRQNRQLKSLGLRKNFSKKLQWTEKSKILVRTELDQNIEEFLRYSGQDIDIWPKYRHIFPKNKATND